MWQPVARVADVRPGDVIAVAVDGVELVIGRDGEMIRSHDLDMLGLDRPAGSPPSSADSDDRVELPAIELSRLGDGEGLKNLTDRAVRAVERAAIAAALRRDRNPAISARRLGISRASIYTKMKTYGLRADGAPTER